MILVPMLMTYKMEQKTFLDSIFQSMRDSARQARLSLGCPSSQATREQALKQVSMLQASKEMYSFSKSNMESNRD